MNHSDSRTELHMKNGCAYYIQLCVEPETNHTPEYLREQLESGMAGLSSQSRWQRFAAPVNKMSEKQLDYLSNIDGKNHVAWCASLLQEGKEKGIAIARYVILHDEVGVAEFAITVLDDYQGQGIGYELIKKLIGSAKANDVNMLIGHIAPGNKRMLNLCKRFDASIQTEKSSSVIALISVKNDYS
ncbi:GNAT family N-acetyltransferase [Solemya velum gill symbiont]|uniref:GNAT family N-acetyltransferase n=1 Tax=Solemya velum gill symbiont TaxID=2340 RepID=UPI00117A31FE|nr:GNAT family N-acetyltransferase [Solemya velum gill symbiont]